MMTLIQEHGLGDRTVEGSLDQRLASHDQRLASLDQRLASLDQRVGPLDERLAREALRRQVARLERRVAGSTMELWESGHREPMPRARSTGAAAARLLTLGELEGVRDALVSQLRAA